MTCKRRRRQTPSCWHWVLCWRALSEQPVQRCFLCDRFSKRTTSVSELSTTLVFFIFLVCNCGGCLLPIGDPPLFLGYLQGVPFLWTFTLWQEWLVVNATLLAIYWIWDHFFAYPSERLVDRVYDKSTVRPLRVTGLPLNLPLMAGVIFAVALLDPSKAIPGTDWHPWIFLREIVLLSLVGCSLWFGSTTIRVQNGFSYFAILEVAALFLGIFVCMQPALSILNEHGASLGIRSPTAFFWTTGALSSVLDNAPTYLVFFKTAQSLPATGELVAGVEAGRLTGISLGAVFLGAMTYIGNGPNFMVKSYRGRRWRTNAKLFRIPALQWVCPHTSLSSC